MLNEDIYPGGEATRAQTLPLLSRMEDTKKWRYNSTYVLMPSRAITFILTVMCVFCKL